jgi:hypothetical protein
MIKKFDEFIFESKDTKEAGTSLLLKLLNDKPTVKTSSKDEKGAYSLSGMKKYFRDNGKTNDQADEAFYLLNKDKSNKIQSIGAKDYKFNEMVPHFFIGLSKDETSKIKEDYEKESLDKNQDIIQKKKEVKKAQSAASKQKKSRKVAVKKSTKSTTKRSTARKTDKKD